MLSDLHNLFFCRLYFSSLFSWRLHFQYSSDSNTNPVPCKSNIYACQIQSKFSIIVPVTSIISIFWDLDEVRNTMTVYWQLNLISNTSKTSRRNFPLRCEVQARNSSLAVHFILLRLENCTIAFSLFHDWHLRHWRTLLS